MKNKALLVTIFVALALFVFSMSYRVAAAQSHGDVWLAFQTDSFMGFPLTHIIGIPSGTIFFISFLYWIAKIGSEAHGE